MPFFVLQNGEWKPTETIAELVKADPVGLDAPRDKIEFALLRHTWRGQIVIRFGPSTELYDLWLRKNGRLAHWVLKDDPRSVDSVAAYSREPASRIITVDGHKLDPFEISERVGLRPEPNQPDSANPTKDTPAFLETADRGFALILEETPEFSKYKFEGKTLKGVWAFVRESPESDFWEFRRSRGPDVQKSIPIFKADPIKQIVFGVVMEPLEVDTQGHYATPEEIEEALEYYMLNYQLMDEQHERVVPRQESAPVQVFIAPVDIEWPVGDSVYLVKKGSWVQATKIFSKDLWGKVESGEINAYSIRGWGKVRDGH